MKLLATIPAVLLLGGVALAKDLTTEIKVKGMTCGSCAVAVKKGLTQTKGVKSAEVSLENNLAKVVYDDTQVTENELRKAIDKTGFKAEPPAQEK